MIRKQALPSLGLACLLALGCGKSGPAAAPAKPPEVLVGYAVSRLVTDYEEFPGRIDAVDTVQVKSRVQGYLTEVHFVDGQEVKEGDLLAIIQQEPFEAQLNVAKAQLEAAKAQVAVNESALELANTTLRRTRESRIAAAPLELEQNEAQVKQSEASVKLAKANQATAQANLATAALNFGFTEIRSPLTGRISRRMVDPGNVMVSDNTVLTTVVSLDPVYVYFDIDERTMLHLERLSQKTKIPLPWKSIKPRREGIGAVASIGGKPTVERPGVPKSGVGASSWLPRKPGLPVAISLADEEGYGRNGVMNFADNVVNQKTGTLRVRGEFDNPDHLLSAGMFCRVQVPIGTAHPAILVADAALGSDQGRKFLYVLNSEDEVSQRDVKVGALHGQLRVVEGVAIDERVVVSGLQRVKSGIKVAPKLKDMTEEKGTREPPLVTNQADAKRG